VLGVLGCVRVDCPYVMFSIVLDVPVVPWLSRVPTWEQVDSWNHFPSAFVSVWEHLTDNYSEFALTTAGTFGVHFCTIMIAWLPYILMDFVCYKCVVTILCTDNVKCFCLHDLFQI
jgi:hypothetical protein